MVPAGAMPSTICLHAFGNMSDLMHLAGHGMTECQPRTAGMCCMSRSHMSGSACYALHAVTGQQACQFVVQSHMGL